MHDVEVDVEDDDEDDDEVDDGIGTDGLGLGGNTPQLGLLFAK
jgi:hypothetical protein